MTVAPTRARTPDALSGAQKSAVLCLALGPQGAARLLQQLPPEDVERISREIASLQAVGTDAVGAVLREFQNVSRAAESAAQGGVDVARQILEQALGPGRARTVLEKIQERAPEMGLQQLRKATPEALAGILRGEHPQTLSLILAHVDPEQAASVLRAMEPDLAGDVLYRMARMDRIDPEVLAMVEAGLSRKTELSLTPSTTESGGPKAVAQLLNRAGAAFEKQMIETMKQRDDTLANQIKNLMFVFEDLLLVEAKGIQRLLREVDTKELGLAMKAASEELQRHIKSNMSERAASALDEEIEMMGAVRVKDVEAAHARIIESVRALEEAGEIMIRGRGGDDGIIA